ncbi:uncharacterized protein LOC143468793 isoform X2 [Clavelina lepadiformis]|uniref:Uncharacterized protein n=1 Tax=Clavelina lepadiformis TaxID=159417 RepID=A0ABP0F0Q5_CLALP
MANVFTKRSKLPRTITLYDYGLKNRILGATTEAERGELTRLDSPTRRQNPQPVGLVYQSPYNRLNQVFGIWNPNQLLPVLRCHETLPHLRSTNFSCQHDTKEMAKYMTPADPRVPIRRHQQEVNYTHNTVQRTCYQWPQEVPAAFRGMVKTTRFGHTPRKAGVGIVPNVLSLPDKTVRNGQQSQEKCASERKSKSATSGRSCLPKIQRPACVTADT